MEKLRPGARGQGSGGNHRGPTVFHFSISFFRRVAWWVRQVSGDAAYENYLRAAGSGSGGAHERRLMTREEFYLDLLRRRYASVSRCC